MRIICLSNSFKRGGRCLAGTLIDEDLNIPLRNNRPIWVRPVCDTPHEEVPTNLTSDFKYYDVIEFTPVQDWARQDYQCENFRIQNDKLNYVQRVDLTNCMDDLCDNNIYDNIFENRNKAISQIEIDNLNYSLMMIKVTTFEVNNVKSPYRQNHQTRLIFKYNNDNYDLPITDPVFKYNYQYDQNILDSIDKIYLVLSLGVEFRGYYYKLVATILYLD